ncbi:Uncharacterized protein dnm_056090 [Desulfonema magnum]|uniref:Uncharacterized protein n=1 Tax=Desulfonema magnum TaxID=45655 RepID=A0A975BQJ7_9BACT|nr:Uncharacterized protein dnm_056090 [Desulfonema magnum]
MNCFFLFFLKICIGFKKIFVAPECQAYRLAIFPKSGTRHILPNCKFGTPDNFLLKPTEKNG